VISTEVYLRFVILTEVYLRFVILTEVYLRFVILTEVYLTKNFYDLTTLQFDRYVVMFSVSLLRVKDSGLGFLE
jgi:hypothetical protein